MIERFPPFEGVANFRDLGGYPTRSGARVRWRRVFRAGAIDELGPRDRALLDELGVRAVIDLRSEAERTDATAALPTRRLTITGRPSRTDAPPLTAAEAETRMGDVYVGLLDHGATDIGQLFTSLACDDILPVVIHCHAGKDRTGLVAALLLELLGVERDFVLDDYGLRVGRVQPNQQAATLERLRAAGYGDVAAMAMTATSRRAMARALQHLDLRYGGIDRYVTTVAGLEPEQVAALRERLLEGGS